MKDLAEWLEGLHRRGVELRRSDDRLKVSAAPGVLREDDLARLREEKTSVFEWLDSARKRHPERAERQPGIVPLSEYQLPFWYLESEHPGSGHLNIPAAFRIHGSLDEQALADALGAIRHRHDALRSVITEEGGFPSWRRLDDASLDASPALHFESVPDEAALVKRLEALACLGIDLEAGPAFQAWLLRLSEKNHVLLLLVHHVAVDGESLARLIDELRERYTAECEGRVPDLAPAPTLDEILDAGDAWLDSPAADDAAKWWHQELGGELPALELPTDRPRPAVPTTKGGQARLRLEADQWRALQKLASDNRATGFMAMLAGLAATLVRISGQHEIVIGLPVSLREPGRLDPAIGLLTNTVALRIPVDADAGFTHLLDQVKHRCLAALEHQRLPIERVVQEVRPERDASRTPLYQVLLGVQPAPYSRFSAGEAEFVGMPVMRGTVQTDLAIWYAERDGGLDLALEYSSDLFEVATAERIVGQFERLLSAVLADPARSLADQEVMSAEDHLRVTRDWATGPSLAVDIPHIDELVSRQSRATPDAPAVRQGSRAMTYAELQAATDQVAGQLAAMGVEPGVLVGICMHRRLELLPVLLGILRAGGAYLPLDPDYPAERRAFMLEDSGAAFLIRDAGLQDDTPEYSGRLLDPDVLLTANTPTIVPTVQRSPEDPAYVIYTSGSTGKPKGVLLPHRAVANFLYAMQETMRLGSEDRVLAITTLSFDIAVLELFLPLTCGASTDVVEREVVADGQQLRERIEATAPTLIQATPAGWQMLIASGWQGAPDLTLLSGGEALSTALAQDLLERSHRVFNMYGPTETTVWSTCHRVSAGDDPVPIGRPIGNTTVYLLDKRMRPVPAGSRGELYIGGSGVSAGYLNRPELNAERFVPDPFSEGQLLYRTGDQARFRNDGAIEYFGRLDNQVKLRGYRIEPGEIEAALLGHPAIDQAVVTVCRLRTGGGDDERLVAYLVLLEGKSLAIGQLRQHLARELPAYMIPQHFVAIDALPLTPSGKVDRKALPAPLADTENARPVDPPATEMERELAGLWHEMLGVEGIGRQDNFFDLGGHSLLSMRLIARLRNLHGIRLRPRVLLLNTLAEIATACEVQPDHQPAKAAGQVRRNPLRSWLGGESRPSP